MSRTGSDIEHQVVGRGPEFVDDPVQTSCGEAGIGECAGLHPELFANQIVVLHH
jgi:hypothetical protein